MSEGTQKNTIPRFVEPRRFAQQGISLSGFVPVDKLVRLSEAGIAAAQVSVDIVFGISEEREKTVQGKIFADVTQQCQRCLGDVSKSLECSVSLAIVWNEEAAKTLPSVFEPWIVSEDEADVYQMVEEEILLNLPFVAFHDTSCIDQSLLEAGDVSVEEVGADENNPFQVLKQLKEKTEK